jgi:hypothetical protein
MEKRISEAAKNHELRWDDEPPMALSLLGANHMVRHIGLMAHTNSTAKAIQQMVRFFLPRCADQSTLRELDEMASDDKKWRHAHDLFSRIRYKTLRANSANDELLQAQYGFEEICAKTLFNMSPHSPDEELPYPFDEDSPFWVIPIAVDFARALGVADPFSVSSLLQPRNARPSRPTDQT